MPVFDAIITVDNMNTHRLSAFLAVFAFAAVSGRGEETITRIALGSCANQNRDQPVWEAIAAEDPQLFLFLGDNVYADTEDRDEMRAAYEKLEQKPGFRALRAMCPVIGVWDDHDYGVNDGGADYPAKEMAEEEFHRFFRTPDDAPSRKRPGTYDVRYFGEGDRRLQVILLDTRYFRGPLKKLPVRGPDGPYERQTDPAVTMLGDAQWRWLAKTLRQPAGMRIILSSIQVIPEDHRWELWQNLPHERARLFRLLKEAETGPVIFLSGDRHMGEISELPASDPLSPGFPVYELTSSGLTNAGGGRRGEPNRHRVSPTNFQKRNFGMVRIDWENRIATLELRDVEGNLADSYEAKW